MPLLLKILLIAMLCYLLSRAQLSGRSQSQPMDFCVLM